MKFAYLVCLPLAALSIASIARADMNQHWLADALQRGPIDNWLPAFAETSAINAQVHNNWYNPAPWNIFNNIVKGGPMNGADNNIGVNQRHVPIQGIQSIHQRIENDSRNFITEI